MASELVHEDICIKPNCSPSMLPGGTMRVKDPVMDLAGNVDGKVSL